MEGDQAIDRKNDQSHDEGKAGTGARSRLMQACTPGWIESDEYRVPEQDETPPEKGCKEQNQQSAKERVGNPGADYCLR